MALYNTSKATTTDYNSSIPDFIVNAQTLDTENADGETYWYFTEAITNYGYYFNIPEINSAVNSLATWATGRGIQVDTPQLKAELDHVTGLGNDSFESLLWNHLVTKKVVGDAFLEIVWNEKKNLILNLLPVSPERVRLVIKKNRLVRYEVWANKEWKKVPKENMIHSTNNRIGDQIHGTSQIDACKFIIDFRNELLQDSRKIAHRDMALGIAYYKTDNTGKISYANSQIEKAVKNGEMVGLPEETVKIEPFPSKSPSNRLELIQYCENFFYQTFGVPRSIATSDGVSEVGGKMGHVIFEPIYSREQNLIEKDFEKQAGIKFKLKKPPSLGGLVAEEEKKNTGQINIQPNDVTADMNRE